jgi:integrase
MSTTPTTMQSHADNYLNERRQLGFDLRTTGYAIKSFARYVDDLGDREPLTVEVMSDWARRDKGSSDRPATWARRLNKLRSFARYLQQFEPDTEVPDDTIFGRFGQRLAPHIYSDQEIVDLLAAARRLGPVRGLRGATYEALFGLIASTGLRVSEAVHLQDADVELKSGVLTIRRTKFAKSRQLPLHPSTTNALRHYRTLRNHHVAITDEAPFFVSTGGQRRGCGLSLRQVHEVFVGLRDQMGWHNRGAQDGPRIHQLRHTFIVRRVMLWHAQSVDIDQAMLALSTYVGHAMVTNTYWYLTGVPELMAVAACKFESFMPSPEACHA